MPGVYVNDWRSVVSWTPLSPGSQGVFLCGVLSAKGDTAIPWNLQGHSAGTTTATRIQGCSSLLHKTVR